MANTSKMYHQKRRRKNGCEEVFHPAAADESSANPVTPEQPHAGSKNSAIRVATDANLLTRTSWTDAKTALLQIKKVGQPVSFHIIQIQRLGYEKIAGKIRGCQENVLAKSFETNPHMIKLALSLKILMALAWGQLG